MLINFIFKCQAVRLQKVNSHVNAVHELSEIMSFDFTKALSNVHKSLTDYTKAHSKSISNDTLARLTELVETLKTEKHQRLLKVINENFLNCLDIYFCIILDKLFILIDCVYELGC